MLKLSTFNFKKRHNKLKLQQIQLPVKIQTSNNKKLLLKSKFTKFTNTCVIRSKFDGNFTINCIKQITLQIFSFILITTLKINMKIWVELNLTKCSKCVVRSKFTKFTFSESFLNYMFSTLE